MYCLADSLRFLYSTLNEIFVAYFDPININFYIKKTIHFHGDLTDMHAKTSTLLNMFCLIHCR